MRGAFLLHRYDAMHAARSPPFAIVRGRRYTRLLGSISLMAPDWEHRRAEVGYWLAREARGHGHATRAVRLICQWGFDARTRAHRPPGRDRQRRVPAGGRARRLHARGAAALLHGRQGGTPRHARLRAAGRRLAAGQPAELGVIAQRGEVVVVARPGRRPRAAPRSPCPTRPAPRRADPGRTRGRPGCSAASRPRGGTSRPSSRSSRARSGSVRINGPAWKAHSHAEGSKVGGPPKLSTVVAGSTATAWRCEAGSGRNTYVPAGASCSLAVDREPRPAHGDVVQLLVAASGIIGLLGVGLDHVLAGLAGRVRVAAERPDAERRAGPETR